MTRLNMLRASTVALLFSVAPLLLAAAPPPSLTQIAQFNPGVGPLVGLACDHVDGTVWVYGDFDADLRHYAADGSFLASVPRPGESADDFDLEIAPEALVLGGTAVPAGALLAINGESGVAEIRAVDKTTGAVLATLVTAFGASHVVGGAYHPIRDTFFLVQDKVASSAASKSLVAEVDPLTGAVLGTFKVDTALPGFTVNFGDLEVSVATGNLIVASSDETSLAEFTPAGVFVNQYMLPAGVSGLSGIGLDDAGGGAWTSGNGGLVSHIGGFAWSALGHALPGTAGTPTLTGTGPLASGSPTTLEVEHGKPLSLVTLVVGFAQANAPFKGGTLVPSPDLLVAGLSTDIGGTSSLAFPWPTGLPSGFALYYQAWISDAAGPKGFAATNGLRSITP
jgi:hypothetical protein